VRLGLARFAARDFAICRGLLRLAELPLRAFERFGSFDPFLRFAMVTPYSCNFHQTPMRSGPAIHLTSYQ
jgi:hypothetical protein